MRRNKMKFESIIKKVSSFLAAFVVFFFAAGMYLSLKGFDVDANGNIVLVKSAEAAMPGMTPKIPANMVMPTGHFIGSENAPITVYEYSSLGCFHCADFHLKTLPKLKKEFIDNGKVKVVFVDFPIDKASMSAAMVARCIPDENYFNFIELLFKNQNEWGLSRHPEKLIAQYAALNGITPSKALECMKNDDVAKEILENRQNAMTQIGIQGTPSFVIAEGSERELLQGAPTVEAFTNIFNKKLENK